MIPFRLKQPQFRDRYAKCLAKRSSQAIATLCWWKAGGWSYPLPATLDVAEGYGGATTIELTEA